MRALAAIWTWIVAGVLLAQSPAYLCPMDPDVRSDKPGVCKRCGMKLLPRTLNPLEYPVDLATQGGRVELTVRDPRTARPVTHFLPVHEKLMHLFVVSQDLEFFAHEHPVLDADGKFRVDVPFPGGGLYRALADFYPEGGTPQMVVKSIVRSGSAGKSTPPSPSNLKVELTTVPAQPAPGTKTMLFIRLTPAEGLEQYLGAWGHLFAASQDGIDLMHTHPFLADGGPDVQFNVIFPRAQTYRIWAQFQRNGVVNTARFDIPVTAPR